MPDKPNCLLFLSWQSDRKDCRNFVSSIVEKLPDKVSELVTVIVDRDTVNVPGSPDIGDTIFEKIDRCDLFIADITLINDKDSGYRRTPNPNVMIELGYAIRALGWERIILLQCIDYGDIEELPFDINHRRICNFSLGLTAENEEEGYKKRAESKKQVIYNIDESIKLLLDKNLLFGGKKGKVPKFEITWNGNNGCMMNLMFTMKNVSSILISGLRSHGLTAVFSDGNRIELEYNPQFVATSLSMGESTAISLNNQMLGYGKGYTNSVWTNIDLVWQFSCEDDEGTEYWYEMKKKINNPERIDHSGIWPVKFIG